MIHIFFVPGMFGSMIEMAVRAFTDLGGKIEPRFKEDGSAHTFSKQHHPLVLREIKLTDSDIKITTPIYPFEESGLEQIIKEYETSVPTWEKDDKILIYAPDTRWAEINLLFQYHKISIGIGQGLKIFGGNVNSKDIVNWNKNYVDWRQMRIWEYREWFSLFYPQWIEEWIISKNQVSKDFLTVSNQQILESTKETLLEVVHFCGLTLTRPIDDFVRQYQDLQKYVLHEYDTITAIPSMVIDQKSFSWSKLSIVAEGILQNHFRDLGYEWRCDGLDILPTNSIEFADIIYQSKENLHA